MPPPPPIVAPSPDAEAPPVVVQPPVAPAPPEDPLDRHARETRDARIKREHKDLVERLRDAEARQSVLDRLSAPVPEIKRREKASGIREGTAVALFSDVHPEERVEKHSTPTGNEYSLEIADRRIARFFSGYRRLIELQRGAFRIADAVLWLGGDLMSGHIHDELVEENQLSPIETIWWMQARVVAGIRELLLDEKIERLTIVCSHGNHGRDTNRPRRSTGAKHSYEWLMYQQIAAIFANEPRVSFVTDQSAHQYVKIYDFDTHWHHGDEVSYGGGVGGITIPLNKAVAQWDRAKRCHFHNFGHFHQRIDIGHIAVNGSVIGFNAYAMSIKANPEVPAQSFYVIDSVRGKTACYPIWVGE